MTLVFTDGVSQVFTGIVDNVERSFVVRESNGVEKYWWISDQHIAERWITKPIRSLNDVMIWLQSVQAEEQKR